MANTPPDDPSQGQTPPPQPPPQPPPVPPAGGGPGYSTRPASATNGMAIASLACSIGGLFCGIGFILGVVFGYIAKNQIDQSGGVQQGRGLAVAGLIIGWVGIGLGVLLLLIAIIASAAGS